MNCRSRWPAVGLLVFSAAFSQLAAQTAQQIQPDPVRLRCGTYCLYVSLRETGLHRTPGVSRRH